MVLNTFLFTAGFHQEPENEQRALTAETDRCPEAFVLIYDPARCCLEARFCNEV